MKNSVKEIRNALASIGNRGNQMEKIIGDMKDRNLEMM